MGALPIERDQVGDAADLVDASAVASDRSAIRSLAPAPRDSAADERQDDDGPASSANTSSRTPRGRVERTEEDAAERDRHGGDDRRHDDAREASSSVSMSATIRASRSPAHGRAGGPARAARSRRRTRRAGRRGSGRCPVGDDPLEVADAARPIASTRTAVIARATSATFGRRSGRD